MRTLTRTTPPGARDDWLNELEAASSSSRLFGIEEVTNGLQELNLDAPQLSAVLSEDSQGGMQKSAGGPGRGLMRTSTART